MVTHRNPLQTSPISWKSQKYLGLCKSAYIQNVKLYFLITRYCDVTLFCVDSDQWPVTFLRRKMSLEFLMNTSSKNMFCLVLFWRHLVLIPCLLPFMCLDGTIESKRNFATKLTIDSENIYFDLSTLFRSIFSFLDKRNTFRTEKNKINNYS